MNSEWVRDNKRRLLFQKRTVNGRTRVYGKAEQGSGGHYGYEGYVDPDEKFIRRPDGERIGRGNHPDLIHAEAQKRRQAQVTKSFTGSRGIHSQVNKPVANTRKNDGAAAEGLAYLIVFLIELSVYGLGGLAALLTVLCLVTGVIGFFMSSQFVVAASVFTVVFIRIFDWIKKSEAEEN